LGGSCCDALHDNNPEIFVGSEEIHETLSHNIRDHGRNDYSSLLKQKSALLVAPSLLRRRKVWRTVPWFNITL